MRQRDFERLDAMFAALARFDDQRHRANAELLGDVRGEIRDAMLFNLAVVYENARHLPKALRDKTRGVDWERFKVSRDFVSPAAGRATGGDFWDLVSPHLDGLHDALGEIGRAASDF
jgi:uncharacterized protein with HEPN domain